MGFRHKYVIFLLFPYWMLCKAFSSPLWNPLKKRQFYARDFYLIRNGSAFETTRSKVTATSRLNTRRRDLVCKSFGGIANCRNYGLIGTRGGSLFSSANSVESVGSPAVPTISTGDGANNIKLRKSVILADEGAFVKPLPDKRQYRCISLASNNLQVLLVSDPDTDTEAAAVHLRTGHFHDPTNRAGLAHFHEHCLFLGTHKYPEENEYEEYLSKHGGYSNAYTDMEDTNYYFCVAPLDHDADDEDEQDDALECEAATTVTSALAGALDRFAHFFISPLFKEDAIERELRAVDSEYSNSLNSDQWRMYQLLKSSCNEKHPFSKFGCGNYNTLTDGGHIHETSDLTKEDIEKLSAIPFHGGTSPRDDLVSFWTQHYQASNMKLVVLGRGTLDDLQAVVEDTFGSIRGDSELGEAVAGTSSIVEPANGVDSTSEKSSEFIFPTENAHYGVAAFSPSQNLGIVREVIPVKESRSIKLSFATPPTEDPLLRKSLPQRLVSHLLGHESPGSLHYVLNAMGYINSLSSGTSVDTQDFSLFSLALGMTPKGMANAGEVLDLCFQWIAMIRSLIVDDENNGSDLLQQYHTELKQLSQNGFQFRENGDPTSFVSSAAEMLYLYENEPEEILRGDPLTASYDKETTKAFLQRLRCENILITITDSDFKDKPSHLKDLGEVPWEQEKWYGATYRNFNIPESLRAKWDHPPRFDGRLQLPGLNQFIATDFSLRCEDQLAAQKTEGSTESAIPSPPKTILETSILRLWHKMDSRFRVPKTTFSAHILTPNVYRSPRTITAGRLFQKVLNDDLNSFVYDATVAGNSYRVSVVPSGFSMSVTGYSQKMPDLLEALTARIMSLIAEMKEGPNKYPILAQKYSKALQNLARETKNFRLDSPLEMASYNSRLLLEYPVWHIDQYIAEMEGTAAETNPLTMTECASLVEEALTGRTRVDVLCMGNVNEDEAKQLTDVFQNQILKNCRPLSEDEIPRFRSNQLPTRAEASYLFKGCDEQLSSCSIVLENAVASESENNNAVEITLQAACDYRLGYEGVAMLELICHLAYPSAFNKLRTQEQLGYIVSANARKTAGDSRGLCIEVQSNSALPAHLEERCEAWLQSFRQELEEMPVERMEMEAAAVVSQLLERDTKLSQEIASAWDEITSTTDLRVHNIQPAFDRLERLASVLTTFDEDDEEGATNTLGPKTGAELKRMVLEFFDLHFCKSSPERRSIVSRVYGYKSREHLEANLGKPGVISSYSEIQRVKQYLLLLPALPYWV